MIQNRLIIDENLDFLRNFHFQNTFGLMENLYRYPKPKYQLQHTQYIMGHQSLRALEVTGAQKTSIFLD